MVGSGVSIVSSCPVIPAPNWIWSWPVDVYLVTNLLGTLCNDRLYGTRLLSELPFTVSVKIVSCPRNGTSYHVFPLLSVIDNIPMILESATVIVLNFSTVLIVSVTVLTSPEIAFTVFDNLNWLGCPLISKLSTTTVVGSYELENEKSIGLSI